MDRVMNLGEPHGLEKSSQKRTFSFYRETDYPAVSKTD